MADRIISDSVLEKLEKEELYIKGYLHDLRMAGHIPDYSRPHSPLPKVREEATRKVKSMFELALEERTRRSK